MSTYTPDRWMVLSITNNAKTHYRVFGSWGGGYLNGDSWKLNSGITKATLVDGVYYFEGSSGSVYECRERSYGATGYTWGVLDNMNKKAADEGVLIQIMEEDTDFLELPYE